MLGTSTSSTDRNQSRLSEELVNGERISAQTCSGSATLHLDNAKHYVKPFHFHRDKPCYCESGDTFSGCCGAINEHKRSPRFIHVEENYLSKTECKQIIRFASKQKRSPLAVLDAHKSSPTNTHHAIRSNRVTERVALDRKQGMIERLFMSAAKDIVASQSKQTSEWIEPPQLLRYGPGGYYGLHSDAEHFDVRAQSFYRFIDRDFSMLIYLNDHFRGGELEFPWLNYQYKPRTGDLVLFPSNHLFSHTSRPILSGIKWALVSWGAFTFSPRIRRPGKTIELNSG